MDRSSAVGAEAIGAAAGMVAGEDPEMEIRVNTQSCKLDTAQNGTMWTLPGVCKSWLAPTRDFAWQGLIERAKLKSGDWILIHGGAGAVGLYAVQLAHIRAAHVITTVSTQDIDFVKQLGANEAIDYKASRFESVVRDVDVVFDAVGGDTVERSWAVLKPGGRMITIAADSEGTTDQRVKDAFFIVEPNQKQLVDIAKQLDAGQLRAFVKNTFPLDEASAAYSGAATPKGAHGKIVISVFAGRS